jgi:hypothetical protein
MTRTACFQTLLATNCRVPTSYYARGTFRKAAPRRSNKFLQFDAAFLARLAPKYSERIVVLGNHDVRLWMTSSSPNAMWPTKKDYEALGKLLAHATHVPTFKAVDLCIENKGTEKPVTRRPFVRGRSNKREIERTNSNKRGSERRRNVW